MPLFLAGIIARGEKKSFQQNDPNNKHTLVTDFKTRIDDYAQFFGPLMTTGLKLGGVEGRSSWGRYLATFGMSYGIMAAFVNSIKYTSKEMRPDGSRPTHGLLGIRLRLSWELPYCIRNMV